MSDVQTLVSKGDPRMIAWNKFKTSAEYQNARRWVIKASNDNEADGELYLWFAFTEGYASLTADLAAERSRRESAEQVADELLVANDTESYSAAIISAREYRAKYPPQKDDAEGGS